MTPRTMLPLVFLLTLSGCVVNLQAPTPPAEGPQANTAPTTTKAPEAVAPAPIGAAPKAAPTTNKSPEATAPVPIKAVPTPEAALAVDGPTEADVRRLVTANFTTTYKESYMTDEEFTIEFGNMSFAPKTQKNLSGGYFDQPVDVWPVRVDVTIAWRRGDEVRTWPRGTQNNESFSFFKDEFGGWSYRTSGL